MNKTPKLRFKEFSGDWDKKKLGKITKLTDGVHFTPTYVNAGVPFWSVETVVSNANPKYITQEAHNDAIKRCYPQINDILLTRIGTLAKPKLIDWDEEFSIYVSLALIKASDNYNSKFARYYFETEYYQKDFLSKSLLTATPKKINMEDLKQTNIKLPSIEEQEKIASFFSLIDDKISLQGEKVDALKDYKKGMMQKIFSRELRFKDDDGRDYPEWKNRRFKEIIEQARLGGNYANSENASDYPLIKMGNISRGTIDLSKIEYVHKSEILNNEDILKNGDLLFNTRNTLDLVGKVAIWRSELELAYYNSNLLRLIFKDEYVSCNYFMNYLFNSHDILSKLKAVATGTTSVAAIYMRDLENIKFTLPSKEEQKKISKLLLQLDEKIAKEQAKLYSLNEYKKGLLQQMFV